MDLDYKTNGVIRLTFKPWNIEFLTHNNINSNLVKTICSCVTKNNNFSSSISQTHKIADEDGCLEYGFGA